MKYQIKLRNTYGIAGTWTNGDHRALKNFANRLLRQNDSSFRLGQSLGALDENPVQHGDDLLDSGGLKKL